MTAPIETAKKSTTPGIDVFTLIDGVQFGCGCKSFGAVFTYSTPSVGHTQSEKA